MIGIDKNKIEQSLQEVCYNYYNWLEPYFIIESIGLIFDEEENHSYSYFIKGRAGDEYREGKEVKFEIQIDPKWSYEFIKGYFYRYLEDMN